MKVGGGALTLLAFLAFGCQSMPIRTSDAVSLDQVKTQAKGRFDLIEFKTLDGLTIRGHLFKPKGTGPFPAIVALHGCGGLVSDDGTMHPRDLEWGERLASAGYLTLYPDSFNPRGIREICKTKDRLDLPRKDRPRDAIAALNWLVSSGLTVRDQIGVMGWSNGGSTLLWAIDQNFPERPRTGEPDFKVAIAFYPGCRTAAKTPTWINRVPLQIHIGEKDDWTSPEPCQAIVHRVQGRLLPGVTAHIDLYSDSFHDFDAPGMPVHKRKGLAYVAGENGEATLGTNEAARALAIQRTMDLLSDLLSHSLKSP